MGGTATANLSADLTPTPPNTVSAEVLDFLTIGIDVPDRYGTFSNFDEFGNIIGLDADMIALLSEAGGFDYELIATPIQGVNGGDGLLEAVAKGTLSAAISAFATDATTLPEGVIFTEPYLEVRQLLVVRANEREINSYQDVSKEMKVSVVNNSIGAKTAREMLGLPPENIISADSVAAALQLVSDFEVNAAIVPSYDAQFFTDRYYQRLKMVDQESADLTTPHQAYAIAVAEKNTPLLNRLNEAIAKMHNSTDVTRIASTWLVPKANLTGAESLIGTPDDRVVIGIVTQDLGLLDTADPLFNFLQWEIKSNLATGLMMYDAQNQLQPALAESWPTISSDGLSYEFKLRSGLTFSDGTPITSETVKLSINRSVLAGNWIVNAFLKNTNGDAVADDDSIQVIDSRTIRFVLREPTAYFISALATPPYFVTSSNCGSVGFDLLQGCASFGPYQLTAYDPPDTLRLEKNPAWRLTEVATPLIELRFYKSSADLRKSLENNSIDIAWHGLNYSDYQALANLSRLKTWVGSGVFKSYLVFEQSQPPWDDPRIRQAAALAINRQQLADDVFDGQRLPLYSPLPNGIPGQINTEPDTDLEQAISILNSLGYSPINPIEIELWYINDGRYTPLEAEYAQKIKTQLESTGIFQVSLQGEAWPTYRAQMSSCAYPAFLLGWPPSTEARYLEGMGWLNYFVTSTDTVCSNYKSAEMDTLLQQLSNTPDTEARLDLYRNIQTLWGQEYPTLDLTQETRNAVSLAKVTTLQMDALGLLRYDTLKK